MSELDRMTRAFAAAVRGAVPGLGFYGFYEYRTAGQSSGRLDLQAVAPALGLPDLVRVTVRPGMAGGAAELATGALVLVGFVGGDPARPFVGWYEPAGGAGFLPVTATLDATDSVTVGAGAGDVLLGDGLGRVLREGDTLTLTGVQSGVSATGVKALVTLGLGAPPTPSKVKA